jgi:hypothetical protein
MSELRELADLIDKHGFTDFEFENLSNDYSVSYFWIE